MHSRAYFTLQNALAFIGAFTVLGGSLFALSFVFFDVRASGASYLLDFGARGFAAFAELFPWVPFLFALVLLLVLENLARRLTFAYRFPLLRSFLWVLVVGIGGSTLIGFTPLHAALLNASDNKQLPVLGPLYEQVREPHEDDGVYRGTVQKVTGTNFVILHDDTDSNSDDKTRTIVPPRGFDLETLSPGKKVYVGGRERHDIIYSYGIRSLPNGDDNNDTKKGRGGKKKD